MSHVDSTNCCNYCSLNCYNYFLQEYFLLLEEEARDLAGTENTPSLPILFRMSFNFSAVIVMLVTKVDLCTWKWALSNILLRFEMN